MSNTVTLNQEQRLFVISDGDAYGCLGFDNLFHRLLEVVSRLARLGKPVPAVKPDEVGTLTQYRQYKTAWAEYAKLHDDATWFDHGTPESLKRVLEDLRHARTTVRIHLGDSETGRDWLEVTDVVGHISRSKGPMKSPLLVTAGAYGGPALLTSAIVKVQEAKTGKILWQHPDYHVPELRIEAIAADKGYHDSKGRWVSLLAKGYTHAVQVKNLNTGEFETHFNTKGLAKASHWLAFLAGEVNTKPQ